MTQGLLVRRYLTGPGTPPVGSPAPSFHRLNICSPGCDNTDDIDPDDCDFQGMVYGNVYCWPAHVGDLNVGVADTNNANSATTASVANFQNRFYGWMNGHIWQFNPVTESALSVGVTPTGSPSGDPGGFTTIGSWVVSASPGSIDGVDNTRSRHTGLYPMVLSGVPYLCTAVHSAANTWRSVRLNGQNGTWESGKESPAIFTDYTVTNGSVKTECRWRNFVLFITSERDEIKLYSPGTEQFSSIPLPTDVRFPMDMCVYNDRPYLLCKNSSGDVVLYEVGVSSISKKLTLISANLGGTDNYEGRNALFIDQYNQTTPRLIAVNFINSTIGGNNGFEQWEIEDTGSGNLVNYGRLHQNIQGFHFPFDAAHSVDGTNTGITEDHIIRIFTDGKQKIDERPEVYIEYRDSGDNGSLYQSYFWQGSGNPWTNAGGVASNFSFSYVHEKGGDMGSRVGNTHQLDCFIRGINFPTTEGSGNIQFEYVMENNVFRPNGTPVAIRFLYDVDGHCHRDFCTLANPSSGTLTSDNRILIPVDSGVIRTVEWDFRADGFDIGDPVYVHTHISTTGVVA